MNRTYLRRPTFFPLAQQIFNTAFSFGAWVGPDSTDPTFLRHMVTLKNMSASCTSRDGRFLLVHAPLSLVQRSAVRCFDYAVSNMHCKLLRASKVTVRCRSGGHFHLFQKAVCAFRLRPVNVLKIRIRCGLRAVRSTSLRCTRDACCGRQVL